MSVRVNFGRDDVVLQKEHEKVKREIHTLSHFCLSCKLKKLKD